MKYEALRRTAEILISDYEQKIAFYQEHINNLLKFIEYTDKEIHNNKKCLICGHKNIKGRAFCSNACRNEYFDNCFSCKATS